MPTSGKVQVLARVLNTARVGVYSDHLDDAARSAHLFRVPDIAAAVLAELERVDRRHVCVLPKAADHPYLVGERGGRSAVRRSRPAP